MTLYQRTYQTGDSQQVAEDVSDQEEEALVNDYKEQVNFDDGMSELDHTVSLGAGSQMQDMQAQLAAAATPLEYQATLDVKFSSYDNYCSLFHYILNSDGPVDLEVPSVRPCSLFGSSGLLTLIAVLLGMGRHRRIHLPIRVLLPLSKPCSSDKLQRRRRPASTRQSKHVGLLLCSKRPLLPYSALSNQRTTRSHETK